MALSLHTNLLCNKVCTPTQKYHWDLFTHTPLKINDKKMLDSENARKGHALLCAPFFPTSVTCCCWATSLDHISREAVTSDTCMMCTRGQNLCLCWHPVFPPTVPCFWLGLEGRRVLTLKELSHTETCQLLQDTTTVACASVLQPVKDPELVKRI